MYSKSDNNDNKTDFRVVTVVKKEDCRECSIKKFGLRNDKNKKDVEYIYIFQGENPVFLYNRIKDAGVRGSIFIDTCNAFISANPQIPDNELFHTFVINKEGKVLMVGNPFQNEKMEALFKKVIAKERKKVKNKMTNT